MTMAVSVAESPAKVLTVRIDSMAFEPVPVAASVGDVIEWSNGDFVDHTATAEAGQFDVVIPVGETRRLPLQTAGTFDYFCRYHPNMKGRITVR